MTFTHTQAGPSSFTINSAGGLTEHANALHDFTHSEQMHFTIVLTPYIYILVNMPYFGSLLCLK